MATSRLVFQIGFVVLSAMMASCTSTSTRIEPITTTFPDTQYDWNILLYEGTETFDAVQLMSIVEADRRSPAVFGAGYLQSYLMQAEAGKLEELHVRPWSLFANQFDLLQEDARVFVGSSNSIELIKTDDMLRDLDHQKTGHVAVGIPSLAIDSAGRMAVAFENDYEIRFAYELPGTGDWSESVLPLGPRPVDEDGHWLAIAKEPHLVVLADGRFLITYWESKYQELRSVRSKSSSPGDGWEEPRIVMVAEEGRGGLNGRAAHAMLDEVPVFVVYVDDLYFVRATNPEASFWDVPVMLAETKEYGPDIFTQPDITVLNARPVVGYATIDLNPGVHIVQALDSLGKTWALPQLVDRLGGHRVSIGAFGNSLAVTYLREQNSRNVPALAQGTPAS